MKFFEMKMDEFNIIIAIQHTDVQTWSKCRKALLLIREKRRNKGE